MNDAPNTHRSYFVEVSGWDFEWTFFVQNTDLAHDQSGNRSVRLRHRVREGSVLFARQVTEMGSVTTHPSLYRTKLVRAEPTGDFAVVLELLQPNDENKRSPSNMEQHLITWDLEEVKT